MKSMLLMSIFLVLFGVSCACPVEKKPSPEKSKGQERPIKIESKLIQAGYELFSVIEAKKPLVKNIYLLAKRGETQVEIRDAAGFAEIVQGIASKEDALELVRLLTSQELRPFLRDLYYSEVHQKADDNDQWFAVTPAQYAQWKLHDPVVTEDNGIYKIERFVACYPRMIEKNQQKDMTAAQLVKIWETVDAKGKYTAELKEVVAEGDDIQKLLIFTK
jgi:hypothetical protein